MKKNAKSVLMPKLLNSGYFFWQQKANSDSGNFVFCYSDCGDSFFEKNPLLWMWLFLKKIPLLSLWGSTFSIPDAGIWFLRWGCWPCSPGIIRPVVLFSWWVWLVVPQFCWVLWGWLDQLSGCDEGNSPWFVGFCASLFCRVVHYCLQGELLRRLVWFKGGWIIGGTLLAQRGGVGRSLWVFLTYSGMAISTYLFS